MLRGSRFRQIFRGVSIAADVPATPDLRVAAALLLFDATAFASHRSAARIYGVPFPDHPLEHVSVLCPSTVGAPPGSAVTWPARRTWSRSVGCASRSPRQMFVELATVLSLVDLVVVGDNLVRRALGAPRRRCVGVLCPDPDARGGPGTPCGVLRPRPRRLPDGDAAADADRARGPARAGGEPDDPRPRRAAHPTLRPVLAERPGGRRVRRAPPRRARAAVGGRPRPARGDRRRRLAARSSSPPGGSTGSPSAPCAGSSRCSPDAGWWACHGGRARRGARTSGADVRGAPSWPPNGSTRGHQGACAHAALVRPRSTPTGPRSRTSCPPRPGC